MRILRRSKYTPRAKRVRWRTEPLSVCDFILHLDTGCQMFAFGRINQRMFGIFQKYRMSAKQSQESGFDYNIINAKRNEMRQYILR